MKDVSNAIVERFEGAQDRLVLQAADFSLETLAQMVENKTIDVDPEFQRRERWSPAKRSALIESFLLNIPVPPIYLAEDEFGSYSVIDGKQRLTAITDFMRSKFQLGALERFSELEGHDFSTLPRPLQNFLRVRPAIRAISLLRQSDPELKYEVFHRLNSGGEPLNAQEIRNVLFRGPLNDLLTSLAENEFLRRQLKIRNTRSPNFQKMVDVEYVLRFFTLYEGWEYFSGDLRKSMDNFMVTHQRADADSLEEYKRLFSGALNRCQTLWGEKSFKRPDGNIWRDFALSGMFDAEMIAVSEIGAETEWLSQLERDRVLAGTKSLFTDHDFEVSVRTATNTPSRLRYRIDRMRDMLTSLR